MKGFKATNNLKCKDLNYEVGKTYLFNGELIKCKQALHFCKNIDDILNYYRDGSNLVIIEVETFDDSIIIEDNDKTATNKFKVNRIIPISEWNDLFELHSFNKNGYLLSKTTPIGDVYEYTYNSNNKIIKEICSDGNNYNMTYDDDGNMLKTTLSNGDVYEYKYDENKRHISSKFADGSVYKWTNNEFGDTLTQTNPDGTIDTYEYEYNSDGKKIMQISSCGNKYVWTYDTNGDTLTKSFFVNDKFKWTTDKYGNILTNISSDGSVINKNYNIEVF